MTGKKKMGKILKKYIAPSLIYLLFALLLNVTSIFIYNMYYPNNLHYQTFLVVIMVWIPTVCIQFILCSIILPIIHYHIVNASIQKKKIRLVKLNKKIFFLLNIPDVIIVSYHFINWFYFRGNRLTLFLLTIIAVKILFFYFYSKYADRHLVNSSESSKQKTNTKKSTAQLTIVNDK